jgi:hypothetical protein
MDEKEKKKNCCQGCWLIDTIVLVAINEEREGGGETAFGERNDVIQMT